MINTDTRLLRRTDNGFISGAGKIPCDHCGLIQYCPEKPRIVCQEFMPALPFSDSAGMEKIFNTVRLGKAWCDRLRIGEKVALYHTIEKRMFGIATVLGTVSGPIQQVLRTHAHANHLMLDKDPADAAVQLYAWQLRNYGPRIVHPRATLSAIYLLRDSVKDFAPDRTQEEEDWAS